mmetsp:Transcript_826/g.2138  ORF Transcript_826/g.2138 Transcript_826/m.2138 type:complete len:456 (+) Transcript_826:1489-2856(+)
MRVAVCVRVFRILARVGEIFDAHRNHRRLLLLGVNVLDHAVRNEIVPHEIISLQQRHRLLLHQKALVLHDEQRAHATPVVRVQAKLLQFDVANDANLRVDVNLPSQLPQRANEKIGVAVDANPRSVDEHLRRARHGRRCNLLEVFRRPFLEKLEDRRRRRADADIRHQCQVLHQSARLSLRRLGWANHSPVAVVQLTRLRKLSLAPNGAVHAPKVAERRRVRETVQHLANARPHVRITLHSPVPGREAVLETGRDRARLHRVREVELLAVVHASLQIRPHVLREASEQQAEQVGEKRATKVEALVAVVISVILAAAIQVAEQKAVHHVAEEVALLRLVVLANAHVREHLLLQYLLGVLYALLSRHAGQSAALSNVVQRGLLALHRLCLVDGRLQRLHHLAILKVVDDVLEYLLVADKAKRTKHDHDGNVLFDVRQRGANRLATLAPRREHLHLQR